MVDMAKESQKDSMVALRESGRLVERAIRALSPSSLRNKRTKRANNNREKWGILNRSIGQYDAKIARLKQGESAGVNVGYLRSKQKKAFISRFMNRGAYNVKTRKYERYHYGYVTKAELGVEPARVAKFYEVLSRRVYQRTQKFNQKWSRKL
jgi:hypothetical protein